MQIGFSYIGLLFLLLLFIPNIIWTKKMPQGYATKEESRVLLAFERTGEILTSCCVLMFSDFNLHTWTSWSWWLIAAFILMALYELWWIRYFRIPVAGASLPVMAFFCLGIYGKVILLDLVIL